MIENGNVRIANLQAFAKNQLQGLRISDLPGLRHETGGQAGGAR
jgi:hypothetical protein